MRNSKNDSIPSTPSPTAKSSQGKGKKPSVLLCDESSTGMSGSSHIPTNATDVPLLALGTQSSANSDPNSLMAENEKSVMDATQRNMALAEMLKRKPINRVLTITQVCKIYPDSKAHAFTLSKNPSCIYFAIGEIIHLRVLDKASQVKVLRLDTDTGDLIVTNLTIMVMDVIQPMSMKDYYNSVMSCYNGLRLKYSISKDEKIKRTIKTYHHYSFKNRRR